jgi:RND family efflux transporter MFP subunit
MTCPFPTWPFALLAVASLALAESRPVQGITEPFLDVTLSPTVQGIIHERHFKEGDEVQEGKVILELDSTLEELETQRRKEVMERNRTDFESTRTLFEKTKSVSKDELDKRQMEYRVAVAELGIAEEQFKRRRILAPFTGTIVEIFLQSGANCEPYQPLVRLVDTKRCYFVGHIDGAAAGDLKIGQKVQVQVQGRAEKIPAAISFIAPVVDSASGLAKVKAIFENADGRVRPGIAGVMLLD